MKSLEKGVNYTWDRVMKGWYTGQAKGKLYQLENESWVKVHNNTFGRERCKQGNEFEEYR